MMHTRARDSGIFSCCKGDVKPCDARRLGEPTASSRNPGRRQKGTNECGLLQKTVKIKYEKATKYIENSGEIVFIDDGRTSTGCRVLTRRGKGLAMASFCRPEHQVDSIVQLLGTLGGLRENFGPLKREMKTPHPSNDTYQFGRGETRTLASTSHGFMDRP